MGIFKCTNPDCPSDDGLSPTRPADGTLSCAACGRVSLPGDAVKGYARATGQWIVGGAALMTVSLASVQGTSSWLLGALGGTVLAYAAYRVGIQLVALRRLRRPASSDR